jgi:hypothetical protein
MSGRIEHQHHHVDHTVASHSFWVVDPRHQELVRGGHDTEAKQEYIASVHRCTRRQQVGDQLGESAKPRPSLPAGNGSAAEDLPMATVNTSSQVGVRTPVNASAASTAAAAPHRFELR